MNARSYVLTILALAAVGVGPPLAEAAQVTGVTPAPSPATTGSAVTITVTGTSGKCSKLELDFGDGSKTTLRDITFPKGTPHTYTTAKTYTLKARGQSGDCSGQKSASLTVNPPPPAPRAAPRATQSIMSVRELCKITDCTPKITSVFLLSVIQPGGGVVVFGERFGGPRFPGQLRLKGLRRWDGAPVGDLPLEDLSWDDTVVGGTIPWVSGVRDQDATLQVVTKAGHASNDQKVRFRAAQDYRALPGAGIARYSCAPGKYIDDYAYCIGYNDSTSFFGYHRTDHKILNRGDQGTDVLETRTLKNGWVLDYMDLTETQKDDGRVDYVAGFESGSDRSTVNIRWSTGRQGSIYYLIRLSIKGPAGLPFVD